MNILNAKQHEVSAALPQRKKRKIIYPDSDGRRMAANTKQFNWIVRLKENLERLFAEEANVLKFFFYERHGAEEYYVYDPDRITLKGWLRTGNKLRPIAADAMRQWTSPRLNIRFDLRKDDLHVFAPDGGEFLNLSETTRQYEEKLKAMKKLAEAEKNRAERLAARLRALGIDPEQL